MNDYLDALAARVTRTPDLSAVRVPPEIFVLAPAPRDPDPVARRRYGPEPGPAESVPPGTTRRRGATEPDEAGRPGEPFARDLSRTPRAAAVRREPRRPEHAVDAEPGEPRLPARRSVAASPAAAPDAASARPGPASPGSASGPAAPAPPERPVMPITALTARPAARPSVVEPARPAPLLISPARAAADAAARLRPPRREAASRTAASAEPAPAPVEIVIDRIDVRLTPAAPRPPRRSAPAPVPQLSLAEYLDRRSQR